MIIVPNVKEIDYSKMMELVSAQMDHMKPVKRCVLIVPPNAKLVTIPLVIVTNVKETELTHQYVSAHLVLMIPNKQLAQIVLNSAKNVLDQQKFVLYVLLDMVHHQNVHSSQFLNQL